MELELRDIFRIIYRQRWLIALLVGISLIGGWVANEVAPPIYEAQTKVLIKGDKATQQLVLSDVMGGGTPDRDLQNYTQVLKSNTVLLDAAGSPERAALLKENVRVEPVVGSDLISISVEGEDPRWIAQMANSVVSAFSERLAEISRQQAHSARKFIEEQLEVVKEDLALSEERLKAYKENNKIIEPQGEISQAIARGARLEATMEEARLGALEADRQLSSLSGALSAEEQTILSATTLSRNPLIAQYQSKIGDLGVQLAGAKEKYTQEHPTVIGLEAELRQAQAELGRQVSQIVSGQTKSLNPTYQGIEQNLINLRALSLANQAKANALSSLQAEAEAQMSSLPKKELELARLARDVKVREEIYLMLSSRREEVRITEAMKTGDVHVVDPAMPPLAPIKPRKMLNIAISVLLALFVGVGMAFLLEYIDDTIKTPQELEAELGLPVLGTIPMLTPQLKRKRRSSKKANNTIRQGR